MEVKQSRILGGRYMQILSILFSFEVSIFAFRIESERNAGNRSTLDKQRNQTIWSIYVPHVNMYFMQDNYSFVH